SEISDDVKNFFAGILEHFRDSPLTEVEAVVGTLLYAEKSLEPVHCSEYAYDSLIALRRNARVVRMARHADLVLLGDGDYSFQEVSNPLPGVVRVNPSGSGQGRIRVRLLQAPRAVHRIAPAGGAGCA